MAAHDPLSHVVDHTTLELPWPPPAWEWTIQLPYPLTRFMVMELIAAVLAVLVLVPVVRHIRRNAVTRGGFANAVEAVLLYIRDDVARPAIGGHGADKFLPFLWTAFFFVLFNNLLGMIPGFASPTGNINVTAMLAVMTLGVVVAAGVREMGVAGFFTGLVPHIDVPWPMNYFLWPLMFMIELVGLLIKHIVLAVRLFANMFAGHVVLAVILGFILVAKGPLFYLVMPASIAGVVALSLLELFVAFLQAYIFTFLSALFIGSAVHPH
ncbi:F0F1 ATP synthase subunit A [Paludisphaera mucosa]|uniref:ATP synthase subunit a n=1 Tax=Paludisphaera mucosa TaxID=3030827 RepID=A0ABT6FGE7_9BACT|nr:F0F1 ATP synthase subunit A [Paludisphaera mucosa]MDG3006584.1 F0F1 ATP synthase subunit A [Paludisphaera mucosa]